MTILGNTKMYIYLTTVLIMCIYSNSFGYTINFSHTVESDGNSLTTPYSWAKVETFDEATLKWSWSGNAQIVNGSALGWYAGPLGVSVADTTNYMTLPYLSSPGSETVTLDAKYNYLGLWWSSIDLYNEIKLYNNNSLVETISGDINPLNVDGCYVNILDLPNFDKIEFFSPSWAFEIDNLAVGINNPVPEPSTFLLLGAGLAGLGIWRRKKRVA